MGNTNPALRFSDFNENWEQIPFGKLTTRVSKPVDVEPETMYQQIGIRSHGKGIFHKPLVDGKTLGNKRVFWVKENVLVVNIVFAWEQAVAKTTEKEIGLIGSHRFPMYEPITNVADLDYLLHFFLTKKGKAQLELASPGGAGRNKTLGQKEFENLKLTIPSYKEQLKIASFLTIITEKITKLTEKKKLLEQYKKGVMQQIFSRELIFKDENGNEFPEWEIKKLEDVSSVIMGQSPDSDSYNTEGNGKPLIQGNADIKNGISKPRNWTTQPTKECIVGDLILTVRAPVGAVAKSIHNACIGRGVCAIRSNAKSTIEYLYQCLLDSEPKWSRLEQGSTFTAISGSDIKSIEVPIPSIEEQKIISNFLSAIDEKINQTAIQLEQTLQFKKTLSQKLFC